MDRPAPGTYTGGVSALGPARRLWRYRDCVALLAARAVKVRYRRSMLGFAWTLVLPLVTMAVLTLVFSRVFTGIPAYALYVVVGVLAWGFFSLACVQSMDSLLAAAGIMKKVYVPAGVFPLAAVAANLVNFLLSLLVLPLIAWALGAWTGFSVAWTAAAVVPLVAFTAGTALLLSAANLFFHDVRYFFEAGSLVWFYATPVVYPAAVIPPELQVFLYANPLYWILEALRAPLWAGQAPSPLSLAGAYAWSGAAVAAGWYAFSRLERRFHEVL